MPTYISDHVLGGGNQTLSNTDGVLDQSQYQNTLDEIAADNQIGDSASNSVLINIGMALATVFVHDNYSGYDGGGVASNGTLIIGKQDTTVSITKDWNVAPNTTLPDSITVSLFGTLNNDVISADGSMTIPAGTKVSLGDYVLNAANNWTISVKNLPSDLYTYSWQETVAGSWDSSMSENETAADPTDPTSEDMINFTLTNTDDKQEIQITKHWDLPADETVPDSADFTLYGVASDGSETKVQDVTLTAANNWTTTISGLPEHLYDHYTLVEDQTGTSYEVKVSESQDSTDANEIDFDVINAAPQGTTKIGGLNKQPDGSYQVTDEIDLTGGIAGDGFTLTGKLVDKSLSGNPVIATGTTTGTFDADGNATVSITYTISAQEASQLQGDGVADDLESQVTGTTTSNQAIVKIDPTFANEDQILPGIPKKPVPPTVPPVTPPTTPEQPKQAVHKMPVNYVVTKTQGLPETGDAASSLSIAAGVALLAGAGLIYGRRRKHKVVDKRK